VQRADYDLVYVDPPYNQHKYMNNYHVWESLVRWDKPAVYGVACKRVDCRDYHSPFNSKPRIREALRDLVVAARARYLLVSFSDEGYLSEQDVREVLSARGPVEVMSVDFKRYVGAKIGIYNPSGEKTGTDSHLRNRELLFLVACENQPQKARTGGAPALAQQSPRCSISRPRSTNDGPKSNDRTPSA
jgi:adenine-specific DNA-methyltransferase